MNYPGWYVNCSSTAETREFMKALAVASKEYSFAPQKNMFISGNLVIAFVLSAVCIAGWMLFLLLFLLPSTNHNRQQRMVHLCVLYFSIVQTVIWKKTNDAVFATQYMGNYQDSLAFSDLILNTTWSKLVRFFSLLFCNVNWIIVTYYLCSASRVISWQPQLQSKSFRLIPKWLSNSTRVVMTLLVVVCTLHAVFFGVLLFDRDSRFISSAVVPFRVSQLTLFTLFLFAIVWYTYHSLKSASTSMGYQGMPARRRLLLFLHDYKEIIPLLIYNITVYMLLYVVAIVQIKAGQLSNHWLHFVIAFVRILIFVNTWGLVGKLETRERKLSKKSLLGRRINNSDRYFVDPKINYGESSRYSPSVSDARMSKRTEKSRLFESYRKIFRSNGPSRNDAESSSELFRLQDMTSKTTNNPQLTERQLFDTESVDTVLTRNVIYDHDAN